MSTSPLPSGTASSAGEPPPAAGSSSPACGNVTTPPATPRPLDERFAEAWLNLDHTVCGIRLRPYCLQHALALQLIGSPFVDPQPREIKWSDIFRAAAICACRFEEHPRARGYWEMVNFILGHALTRRLTRGRLGSDLALEAERFRTYQNDYQSEPDLFFEGEGKELTAPVLLGRAVYLHAHCGLSEKRAWTMPIGKALWTYAAHLEQSRPGVSLLDEEDSAYMEWIKDIQSGRIPLPPELQPEALAKSTATATAAGRIDPDVFGPTS